MRLGINAQLCSPSSSYRNAGISQYIRHLVHGMGSIESQAEMHLFLPGVNRDPFPETFILHHRRLATEHPVARIAWEQFVLPLRMRRLKLDLLHSPMHVLPGICPAASVVSVLDLTFMLYPGTFPRPQRRYLEAFTRHAVRKADAVIAISESTRRDVIDTFGVTPSRVYTTPLGFEDSFRPLPDDKLCDIKDRYGIGDMCLLYVGTLEPRKNICALLTAFARVRRDMGTACGLVLAGGKGWFYDQVFRQVEELGMRDAVRFTGYVPREELPALYCSATAFVYPSLYEGFGLPPLEAMACGTPVITSNTSSLPEVVGDAGIMVDPMNADELADAIISVLKDPGLREDMRQKGLKRASDFSWKETARRTLKVYQDVTTR